MAKESTQLVELVEAPKLEGKGTPAYRAVFSYKRLDGNADGKTLSCNKLVSRLTEIEKDLAKEAWSGDKKLTIVKEETTYTGKDGTARTAWNLKEIKAASAYVPKEVKGEYKKGGKTGGYDNVGMQIGNAINNAVLLEGQGATNETLLNRARAIIKMGNTLREEYESLSGGAGTVLAAVEKKIANETRVVEENKENTFDDFESLSDQDFF